MQDRQWLWAGHLAAFGLFACVASTSHAQANLVGNGGFETGDFTGWIVSDSSLTKAGTDEPHSGIYAAELGNRSVSTLEQSIPTVAGQIVGYSEVPGETGYHAMVWNAGVPTDLGTLGQAQSFAVAINDAGAIVGSICDANQSQCHAALWDGATAIDLNSVLSRKLVAEGWVLEQAVGINNHGSIVGSAFNGRLSQERAYVLSVVTP